MQLNPGEHPLSASSTSQPFPAIAIGGPPHSGKSVLTYSLTQLLRDQRVDHYVLRACPDGEGDWSNEAEQTTVRKIRYKGEFSGAYVTQVCEGIAQRHLPLLVDLGGKRSDENRRIVAHCTHIILLAADEAKLAPWREWAHQQKLTIIAELISSLDAPDVVYAEKPWLRARIHGLERGQTIVGPAIQALARTVQATLTRSGSEIRTIHRALIPHVPFLDLDDLRTDLGLPGRFWTPSELALALAQVPHGTPLALYGRNTNWVYSAFAAHIWPAPFHLFDARRGWVQPAIPAVVASPQPGPIRWELLSRAQALMLHTRIDGSYLDDDDALKIQVPTLAPTSGIVLSGKIPHWLITGLVVAYRHLPWVAVYHPQIEGGVVVWSQGEAVRVGEVMATEPPPE